MLEAASLLISPWQPDGGRSPGWSRPIADARTGASLGKACLAAPAGGAWLDWLRGRRVEVLETDDAALLMTLARPWGLSRRWEVYDAEERRVGTIYPAFLLDGEGEHRAVIDGRGRGGKVFGAAGELLAEYGPAAGRATQLAFAASLEPNPFLRMLLLAAVLVQEPTPG